MTWSKKLRREVPIWLHRAYDSFGNVVEENHFNAAGYAVIDGMNGYVDVQSSYTGKYFDEATGLQNNWNRWFDPAVGKWISEDRVWDGVNRYAYVGNKATSYVDFNGLEEDEYIREIVPGQRIGGRKLADLPPPVQRALLNSDRYRVDWHSGGYYTILDQQQGGVQTVCDAETQPLELRQRMTSQEGEGYGMEAAMYTLYGEIMLSLPVMGGYRDAYEWWTGEDLLEKGRRLTPDEQHHAGQMLFMPGGTGAHSRHADDLVEIIQDSRRQIYPDPYRPRYDNGALHVDHKRARSLEGHPTDPCNQQLLPAETNLRKGGHEGVLLRDRKNYEKMGLTREQALSVLEDEIRGLGNSPPPRLMDPHELDLLQSR